MKLIKEIQKNIIEGQEKISFSSFSSFHLIVVTARVKGEKQISQQSTDDEDLTVEIDGKSFPKISSLNNLIDSPAAFSGGKQHNLPKTVYFLTHLSGRDHEIILKADQPQNAATIESVKIYTLSLDKELIIDVKNQAEDGDRREWIGSYKVAVGVLSGNLSDATKGATNFHSFKDPKDFPVWATKETFKIKLGNIYFYELEK